VTVEKNYRKWAGLGERSKQLEHEIGFIESYTKNI
jgi:hypothetical protein